LLSHLYTFPSTSPPSSALYTLSLHDALPILPDTTAPRAASSAVFETVRLWTVSGWPPSRMCPAIGRPMIPNPMNPTGVLSGCVRSEEHTSELQSRVDLVCRLLLEKKKKADTT